MTVPGTWESQHCRVIFSTWEGGEVEMARAPHFPADLESPVDFMLMVGRCARPGDRQESGGRWTDGRPSSVIAIIYLRRRSAARRPLSYAGRVSVTDGRCVAAMIINV